MKMGLGCLANEEDDEVDKGFITSVRETEKDRDNSDKGHQSIVHLASPVLSTPPENTHTNTHSLLFDYKSSLVYLPPSLTGTPSTATVDS
ncbi:hypothetical protein L1887_36597 [Cichorium endivia]|nr:hypothetical protein L1887_36597 [Cichorium endivia]